MWVISFFFLCLKVWFLVLSLSTSLSFYIYQSEASCQRESTQRGVVIPEWTKCAWIGNHSFNLAHVKLQQDVSIITNQLLLKIKCVWYFFCFLLSTNTFFFCGVLNVVKELFWEPVIGQWSAFEWAKAHSDIPEGLMNTWRFLIHVLDTGNQIVCNVGVNSKTTSRQVLKPLEWVSP